MNSTPDTLPDIEVQALQAILAARSFAHYWRKVAPKVAGLTHEKVGETLQRLDEGTIFAQRDESLWPKMEQALVDDLNARREGYGSYALVNDTSFDDLWDQELDDKRWLMECWKAFKAARQVLIDRRRAAKLAAFFSG